MLLSENQPDDIQLRLTLISKQYLQIKIETLHEIIRFMEFFKRYIRVGNREILAAT